MKSRKCKETELKQKTGDSHRREGFCRGVQQRAHHNFRHILKWQSNQHKGKFNSRNIYEMNAGELELCCCDGCGSNLVPRCNCRLRLQKQQTLLQEKPQSGGRHSFIVIAAVVLLMFSSSCFNFLFLVCCCLCLQKFDPYE